MTTPAIYDDSHQFYRGDCIQTTVDGNPQFSVGTFVDYNNLYNGMKTTLENTINNILSSSDQLCGPYADIKKPLTAALQKLKDYDSRINTYKSNTLPLFNNQKEPDYDAVAAQSQDLVFEMRSIYDLVNIASVAHESLCQVKPVSSPKQCNCTCSTVFADLLSLFVTGGGDPDMSYADILGQFYQIVYQIPNARALYQNIKECSSFPTWVDHNVYLYAPDFNNINPSTFYANLNTFVGRINKAADQFSANIGNNCNPATQTAMSTLVSNIKVSQDALNGIPNLISGKTLTNAFNALIPLFDNLDKIFKDTLSRVVTFYDGCPNPPALDPNCPGKPTDSDGNSQCNHGIVQTPTSSCPLASAFNDLIDLVEKIKNFDTSNLLDPTIQTCKGAISNTFYIQENQS